MEFPALGFMGVGDLAAYTIKGLRQGGFAGDIFLGPRNQQRAQLLGATFNCRVMRANQAVADASDILILSVRPEKCRAVLEAVNLNAGQLLLSVAAGINIATLGQSVKPEITIVRAMPVSSAEAGASPTLIFPPNDLIKTLFDYCGTSIELENESAFDHGSVLACVYCWYFELFETLIRSTSSTQLPAPIAKKLVLGMAQGAASLALQNTSRSAGEIAQSIARDGTFSKLGLDRLNHENAFEPWRHACQDLLKKLT